MVTEKGRDDFLTLIACDLHARKTRYSNFNLVCPRYKRKSEGGRSFSVSACQLWNSLPLDLRQIESFPVFKHFLWNHFFNQQQFLNHFIVSLVI